MKTDLSQTLWVVDVVLLGCELHAHHGMAKVIARRDSDKPHPPGHSKSGWIVERFAFSNN